jgi:hypothetical protein
MVPLLLLFPANCTHKKKLYLLFNKLCLTVESCLQNTPVIHRITQLFKLETSMVIQPCFEWQL